MELSEETYRQIAKQANGRVWELLGQSPRSPAEDAELVEAAHASLYCWRHAGTEVHRQRGLWLIAHTYSVLGEAALAVKSAQACLAWTDEHEDVMEDFDLAYAYEGMARASALAGDKKSAQRYLELAREAGEQICDPEDKDIFTADLQAGEWYGVS